MISEKIFGNGVLTKVLLKFVTVQFVSSNDFSLSPVDMSKFMMAIKPKPTAVCQLESL